MNEKLNAIIGYLLEETDEGRGEAKALLRKLMGGDGAAEDETESRVDEALIKLGVPTHFKGFRYLSCAIKLAIEDKAILDAVTKELYPKVAKLCATTPTRAERAMRLAIEVACERGDMDLWRSVFGGTVSPSKGKPSNWAFVSLVALRLSKDEIL